MHDQCKLRFGIRARPVSSLWTNLTAFIFGQFLAVFNLLKPQVFALVEDTYEGSQQSFQHTHQYTTLMSPNKGKTAVRAISLITLCSIYIQS